MPSDGESADAVHPDEDPVKPEDLADTVSYLKGFDPCGRESMIEMTGHANWPPIRSRCPYRIDPACEVYRECSHWEKVLD